MGINYLNKFPSLIDELKVNVGSAYLNLSDIDNKIIELEQEKNNMVYEIFEVNSEEINLIENFINLEIPYLP